MAVPISQMWTVASYVIRQNLRGRKRYPLILMLEPLFRCNLACAGCGKIQYPADILKQHLTPEQCFAAADECGAPIVSIPGGEPLLHPQIDEIVDGLVARKKYVYLCTNALLLEKHIDRFQPSKYLSFSVHLDGGREEHDFAVCREGVYDIALRAIRLAISKGFRVTTNTTAYNTADVEDLHKMFDLLMDLGVEGMMLSPGYAYERAPGQELFLQRQQTTNLFQRLLGNRKRRWRFNLSPLFLEYLQGQFELECTPWGSPAYNLFGWQRPCYLLQEGHAKTYQELLDTTDWSQYGRASGNPKCANCMVHCGYEPTAVAATFNSWAGLWRSARLTLFGQPRRSIPEGLAPAARPDDLAKRSIAHLSQAAKSKTLPFAVAADDRLAAAGAVRGTDTGLEANGAVDPVESDESGHSRKPLLSLPVLTR